MKTPSPAQVAEASSAGGSGEARIEPLIRLIEDALGRRDESAMRLQRKWFRFGGAAAMLGPSAVLLLAVQVLVFPHIGPLAILLILLELLALAVALAMGFLRIGEAHLGWVSERLRAELLRRERFLFRAHVGPYLGLDDASAAGRVKQRLAMLDSDLEEPLPLTALKDAGGVGWRNALEDAHRAGGLAPVPDLSGCMQDYLDRRVADQRTWLSDKVGFHATRDRILENGAKVALTLALIVAAIHLGMLLARAEDEHGGLATALILTALVLPPLGAACVGFRALLEGHRISRSYLHHARALAEIERELIELQNAGAGGVDGDAGFSFRRLVLQTEELLAAELRQWWFVMQPSVPTAEV